MSETETLNPLPGLQGKFDLLYDQMTLRLVERNREIRAAINAVLGGRHVFLHGFPGIAKSFLVDMLCEHISGTRQFSILMTRFTTPPEVFGPTSLSALKADRFERKIDGYLPMSDFAFIDEIFKANSSILNALLWAMNERKYRHGDKVIPIDLGTLFCASNEFPQGDELGALYDRVDVRLQVNPIKDPNNFIKMLDMVDTPVTPVLTMTDVLQAKTEVRQVVIPREVMEGVVEIKRALKEEGIEPTDRRFRTSLSLVRAAAWQDGLAKAEKEHLRPLQNVLWDQPEHIPTVDKVVLSVASPLDAEVMELKVEIDRLEDRLNGLSDTEDRERKGTEIYTKLRRCKTDLDEMSKKVGNSRRRKQLITEVHSGLLAVTRRVLSEVYKIDPENFEGKI